MIVLLFLSLNVIQVQATDTVRNDEMLSLDFRNASLKEVFKAIETKTHYHFFYNTNLLNERKKITVRFQDATIQSALEMILEQVPGVEYIIQDDQIILKKKRALPAVGDDRKIEPEPDFEQSREVISLNKISEAMPIDQFSVSGVVFSESGPMPGVNIIEKGTTNGTTSDVAGKFSIRVEDENAILVFSFIGYATREVPVNKQSVIEVTLDPDVTALQEIVVVGYGSQIKKDVTGAISSVKAKDMQGLASTSVDALLQGKAAGVQVVQNSGTPGGEIFVRIRGTSSLIGETRPLFVIDGVPMNNNTSVSAGGQRQSALADVNPNDIESFEILKDAAATAIYGSRGSNGVVLITTKRGKSGKARINFEAYSGIQSVQNRYQLLDGQQFVDLLREELTNRNPSLLNNPPYNQLSVTGINTDYQREIFRDAPISNYTLSLTGGDEKMTSYISLGYFKQEGTIIGQQYDRITGRINLDYQAAKRLKVGTSTTFSSTKQARVENDFSSNSILANALTRNPNLPVRNDDNSYSIDPLETENPVQLANEITFDNTQRRIVSNVYAQYNILENLTFRSVIGIDYLDDRVERFIPSVIINRKNLAEARAIYLDEQTVINDNTLTFNKTIQDHKISALAGFGWQRARFARLDAGGQNAATNIIRTVAISAPFPPSHEISDWGLISYFARANYSFKDKYLLEASVRVDGSSRFGASSKYGTFPGLSLGWRVSEESFMNGFTMVSDLKLRAGIGVTGNQEGIGSYPSLALYGPNRNYDNNPGIGQIGIPNIDLRWESTTTNNVGLDVSLFDSRVNITIDAYLKETSDLLFSRQLPWTSGFSSIPFANIGSMENRGLEFSVSTRNLTGNLKWNTDFNIAFNRTEITSLPVNGQAGSDLVFQSPSSYGVEGPYGIYRIGQPIGSFYGHVYQGVYASDADVPRIDDLGGPAVTDLFERGVRGGDANHLDINNDGVINRQFDRVIIGNALPKHIGGITNSFSYKGVDLSIVVNWSFGNQIYNMTRSVLTGMVDDYNQSTEVLNRWRQQGDVTNVPKAIYASSAISGAAPHDASSRYIEDGSFLRFRNISLGYNFPSSLLSKINLTSARIYVSGQNLITLTNYSGLDPENQNVGTGIPMLGVDYLTQPQPRIVMMGINLAF